MMQINPAPFHLVQTVFTGLVLALSVAILGTSAHTLDVFNKQRSTNPWWVPLWQEHFDTHGTKALLASSVVTFVLSALFLVTSVVPKFELRQKYTLRALISLGTILPSFLLSLVALIWAHILNRAAPDYDTIQTWTCKYRNQPTIQQSVPSNMSSANFASLCRESRFAMYGTLTVALLLALSMVSTVVTWLADKFAARRQRKEGVEMGMHA